MRLNKFIAHTGYTSRRKADELIFAGEVKVNNQIVTEPYLQVDPKRDKVSIKGKLLSYSEENIYLMLNKPIEVITSAKDEKGRKCVLDLLPEHLKKQRPFPVGRLDYFSEGLLLLTTDGKLCYRLTHPKYKIPKTYVVKVRGENIAEKIKIMQKGMTLKEGEKVLPAQVKVLKTANTHWEIELTITQGLNRQIRRMCRDLDLTVLKLVRIQLGPLHLGNLARGKFKHLTTPEKKLLLKAVGLI
jgi:23S rRNA pseudouridine2605 synthase